MEGSGSDQDAADQQNSGKKRYHRHTAHQIQELESLFKKHPHPDEKQRLQLSRDLGLEPRQVKFWFQNRRTQMKAQGERADNNTLRAENERIRGENLAIREALKFALCSNCGGPPGGEISFEDQQRLRLENARLKEELDRLSGIAAKYIGRPVQTPASLHPLAMPSLDLGVVGFGVQNVGPSTDIISSGQSLADFAMPTGTGLEKNLIRELAMNAVEEVTNLAHTDEPLWIRNINDNKDVLSLECYTKIFPRAMESKAYNVRKEVTRDSGLVNFNGHSLADIFMDTNKWIEMFPTIVARAKTVEVLIPGTPGNRHGSLQLMYAELHVLSHLVLPREIYFLRYCHQSPDGVCAIVDVSVDNIIQHPQSSLSRCRKLPSGLVIQDMPNGYSKVTWIEHVEPEDRAGVHRMYRQLVNSGMAFGAQRWLATLQRNCERLASLMGTNITARELGAVSSPDERRFLMKLAQRMTSSFCANISASTIHRWSAASGSNDDGVRVTTRKNTSSSGTVLSAATSLWLPVSPQRVFEFFRDKQTRPQWDAVSGGNSTEEVVNIANGSYPGNCTTLFRAYTAIQNNLFILQESSTDSSGSLIVYAPVDINAMKAAMNGGGDPSIIPVLPSGISILPDGSDNRRLQASSSNSSNIGSPGNAGGGSLLTVVFEIHVGNSPFANMDPHTTANHIVNNAVQHIKAALHCLDV